MSDLDYRQAPWEHPDWYDLHDDAFTAGIEREPEHYRELVLALPPLDHGQHLVDAGCGTGKAAIYAADAYPGLGRVTLLEPSQAKLERAHARVQSLLPDAVLQALALPLGEGIKTLPSDADVVLVGSVLMPTAEMRGGSHADALAWIDAALGELLAMLRPGGELLLLETLGLPWTGHGADDEAPDRQPARRLSCLELEERLAGAGFAPVEVVYRFRDRVVLRAARPS